MSKSFVFGFVFGLGLLTVAGVGASRLTQKKAEQAKRQADLLVFQAELGDATPVQNGVLTEKQRVHSSLYTRYLLMRSNLGTISELVGQAKGKSRIVETGAFLGMVEAISEPRTPESYFGDLANESHAVIRGRATKKVSQITEDDGFIFTDYEVVVTEVLKRDNATTLLSTGATITVTRPGGKVLLDGIVVKARDEAYAPLPLDKHDVVLFLRLVPETGAYQTTRDSGAFELDGSSVRPLTGYSLPPGVLRDARSFLQTVRAVSQR